MIAARLKALPLFSVVCCLHFRGGGFGALRRRRRGSNRRHEDASLHLAERCAHTPPSATTYREISPHQSLRDSFSGGRSRLAAAYRLRFRAELKLKRPTAVLKYRNLFAVSCFGGDVQILCAYHKVLMYNRLIYAFFSALIKREIFTALYA